MARTREEFIDRWRKHLAGLALYGTLSEIRDGPLARASKVLEIPAEVERLLGQMFDDLNPKPLAPVQSPAAQPKPVQNGQAQPQGKRV